MGPAEREKRDWKETYQGILELLDNAFIEFIATTIALYSAVYVPHFTNDPFAQFFPGFAILVVYTTLKDEAYFCPDGSFMVTTVLLCGGAYTDANNGTVSDMFNKTNFKDVFVRWFGQVTAWVMVYYVLVMPHLETLSGSPFAQNLGKEVLYANEMIATAIECIGTAFCILPLMIPYTREDSNSGSGMGKKMVVEAFPSKRETRPPSAKHLFLAALQLAILHTVLERLFKSTMNPFSYSLHCEILAPHDQCDIHQFWMVCGAQGVGLAVACLYTFLYIPSGRVLEAIFKKE
jgi:hypothetical protein